MDKHQQFAKRWFDHSKSLTSTYMEFLCHYICLEILIKSDWKNVNPLIEALKPTIHTSILKGCNSQIEFFKVRVIHNEYNIGKRNTEYYIQILKNSNESDLNRIIALIGICKIVRGNIMHGHKEFDNEEDQRITTSCSVFFRSLFRHIFL